MARACALVVLLGFPLLIGFRYKVSDADAERRFREVVARREEGMRSMEGFVSHELREEGDGVFTVEQMYGGGCTLLRPTIHLWNVRTEGKGGRAWRRWESKQCYERWMKSEERRKSHFGSGVWQVRLCYKRTFFSWVPARHEESIVLVTAVQDDGQASGS